MSKYRDQQPEQPIGQSAQSSRIVMAGSTQGVVLLPASRVAIDAGRCPVINGLSKPGIASVPHLDVFFACRSVLLWVPCQSDSAEPDNRDPEEGERLL
jgi:hypothetical protein